MKKISFILLVLISPVINALNIHNVQITQSGINNVHISLTTEAQELYYFNSWNYSVNANVITVNAFFIEGFGSTIAYLNNNFTIPLLIPQQYTLILRVFYTNTHYQFKTLQDMIRLVFRFRNTNRAICTRKT